MGENEISKNVTDRHFTIIYISSSSSSSLEIGASLQKPISSSLQAGGFSLHGSREGVTQYALNVPPHLFTFYNITSTIIICVIIDIIVIITIIIIVIIREAIRKKSHKTADFFRTSLRGDWILQNGCFFGKLPNGLDPPPVLFWKLHYTALKPTKSAM